MRRKGILERHAVVQEGDLLHDGYRAAWFQLEIPGDELGRSPGADADVGTLNLIMKCLTDIGIDGRFQMRHLETWNQINGHIGFFHNTGNPVPVPDTDNLVYEVFFCDMQIGCDLWCRRYDGKLQDGGGHSFLGILPAETGQGLLGIA